MKVAEKFSHLCELTERKYFFAGLKWKGYDDLSDNTWEPLRNLECYELIEGFESKQFKEASAMSRKRKGTNAVSEIENNNKRMNGLYDPEGVSMGIARLGNEVEVSPVVSFSNNKPSSEEDGEDEGLSYCLQLQSD